MKKRQDDEHSATSTGIRFVRLAPALGWLPRWFRYNFTFQNAVAVIAAIFAAGVGWSHWHLESKMDANQKALQAALGLQAQQLAYLTADIKDQKEWRSKIELEYEKPTQTAPPPLIAFPHR